MSNPKSFRRAAVASLVASTLAFTCFSAFADIASCRALIGFDTAAGGVVVGGGAWETVALNRASFLSNNDVANCEVPVVTAAAKGKPDKTVFVGGPMTSDECSMYKYLSSIDSKLATTQLTGKVTDPLTVVTTMISKIDGMALSTKPKIVDPGYTAVRDAASGIQDCIALLP